MSAPTPPASASVPAADSNFDRVAWFYDALAAVVFGPALRRAQQAALAALPAGAPHVLILGGGSGWVLTEVLRRQPRATVLYLEASAEMLRRAQAALARQAPGQVAQVRFCHGTEAGLPAAACFDVVITFFVLDCLAAATFGPALTRLYAVLRPGGHWLVAEFSPPRRWWQRGLLAAMYLFFKLSAGLKARQLPAYPAALAALGLRGRSRAVFFGGAVQALALQKPCADEARTANAGRF